MKKRYIVCINASTAEQEQQFIDYLRSNNFGWWHWISNTWLISDKQGKSKASLFRDKVKEIFIDENILVIEINSQKDTWAGFGPVTEDKNMFKWIKENWKKD